MRILVLCGGSGFGNTSKQCQTFVSSLPEDWDAEVLQLCDMDLKHCTGCNACRGGKCVFEDDMGEILRKFDNADAVMFATPIRFNGVSSIIKTVVDRFQLVWNVPDVVTKKKRYMTFIASGGSDSPNVQPLRTVFRSFCISFGGEWVEHHLYAGTDENTSGMESAVKEYGKWFANYIANQG